MEHNKWIEILLILWIAHDCKRLLTACSLLMWHWADWWLLSAISLLDFIITNGTMYKAKYEFNPQLSSIKNVIAWHLVKLPWISLRQPAVEHCTSIRNDAIDTSIEVFSLLSKKKKQFFFFCFFASLAKSVKWKKYYQNELCHTITSLNYFEWMKWDRLWKIPEKLCTKLGWKACAELY